MHIDDLDGKTHAIAAAEIQHHCVKYKGGRMVFLWANILGQDNGPTIALDLMRHAICTTPLKPGPVREPCVALLPRDVNDHDKVIIGACTKAGMKTYDLKPDEFIDPAVFNPRNFPIAIHAAQSEVFLDRFGGRSDLGQVYVNYVKSGGLLIACGDMWQFYYPGGIGKDGKLQRVARPRPFIPTELGLSIGYGLRQDPGPKFLRCVPGQDVIRFDSPIALDYIHWGHYRAAKGADSLGADFVPIAQMVDKSGKPFQGYVIALQRYKSRGSAGAEVLWFWGELLDKPCGYPLFEQMVKYAHGRRKDMFQATP